MCEARSGQDPWENVSLPPLREPMANNEDTSLKLGRLFLHSLVGCSIDPAFSEQPLTEFAALPRFEESPSKKLAQAQVLASPGMRTSFWAAYRSVHPGRIGVCM